MAVPDFFYSDPHFGHAAVIEYSSRPFAHVSEMNNELIRRYNAVVGPEHTVLWVGDCFFTPVHVAAQFMRELNGRKLLVRGNHDGTHGRMTRIGFHEVYDHYMFTACGVQFQASHFHYDTVYRKPTPRAPERLPGVTLLHGHTHSTQRYTPGAVHVGVDAWDYAPVSLGQVLDLVQEARI